MTRRTRLLIALVTGLAALSALALMWRRQAPPARDASRGRLVAALRAEPRSLNRLVARDRASLTLAFLLHGRLTQLNHETQELEPSLAERWTLSDDGRTYRFILRKGVAFADGTPFTARDVLFTFKAIADPKVDSSFARSLGADGAAPAVTALDDHTVEFALAAPYAPLPRVLSSITILPAHKLAPLLEAGTLRNAWTLATPPADLTGLGPFVIERVVAGQQIDLVRNPRYWRAEAGAAPGGLPRLDRLTLRIIPDSQAELLALESGGIDLMNGETRAEDLAAVRRLAQQGTARVHELGVDLDADSFWFNLGPAQDKRPDSERPWLDVRFRRAVSHAIDRQAFVNAVMLGEGTPIHGPVTPGNRTWHDPTISTYPYDVGRAQALLAEAGLTDRNRDGVLETTTGKPIRLQLATQRGNAARERAASIITADLRKVGLVLDVVTFDAPTLGDRLTKGQYDAALFAVNASDADPSTNLDYWMSAGQFHIWHPSQKSPATPWEKEIDDLMREVTALRDPAARKERFARVQHVLAEQLPVINLAARRLFVTTSARVNGARPGALFPYIFWQADTLAAAASSGTN